MDLITYIILACGVTGNVDINQPKYANCIEYYVNCVINNNNKGKYTKKDIEECEKKKKRNSKDEN